jgi:hypothetical protein
MLSHDQFYLGSDADADKMMSKSLGQILCVTRQSDEPTDVCTRKSSLQIAPPSIARSFFMCSHEIPAQRNVFSRVSEIPTAKTAPLGLIASISRIDLGDNLFLTQTVLAVLRNWVPVEKLQRR